MFGSIPDFRKYFLIVFSQYIYGLSHIFKNGRYLIGTIKIQVAPDISVFDNDASITLKKCLNLKFKAISKLTLSINTIQKRRSMEGRKIEISVLVLHTAFR